MLMLEAMTAGMQRAAQYTKEAFIFAVVGTKVMLLLFEGRCG